MIPPQNDGWVAFLEWMRVFGQDSHAIGGTWEAFLPDQESTSMERSRFNLRAFLVIYGHNLSAEGVHPRCVGN